MCPGLPDAEPVPDVFLPLAEHALELHVIDRMHGEEEGIDAVAPVHGREGIGIEAGGGVDLVPELEGLPLADVFRLGEVITRVYMQGEGNRAVAAVDGLEAEGERSALGDVQELEPVFDVWLRGAYGVVDGIAVYGMYGEAEVHGGVAPVDALMGQGGREWLSFGGRLYVVQADPVLVVVVPLACGIPDNRVVEGMHGEVKGAYGVAPMKGFQGITDDGVPHDRGEVEPVSGVIVPLAHLAGENRIIYGMHGEEKAVHAVAAVHGGESLFIRSFLVVWFPPPHDGVPLANLPFGFEDIGLANEEAEVYDRIASVDAFIGMADRKGLPVFGRLRMVYVYPVLVVAFSLADGVIDNRVVDGVYREIECPHGITEPAGLQSVADNSIFHDFREVEPILGVTLSLAHLAEENRIIYGVYGEEQAVHAVAAVHSGERLFIRSFFCV